MPAPRTPPAAVDLIVFAEVTSRQNYERRLMRPNWPGGSSGVTIGIGYDLAHHDADDLATDWPTLRPADREALAKCCGKSGMEAKFACDALPMILIPWDAAYATFRDRSLPKYEAMTVEAIQGADKLPPACYGALVSLVYNRGTSMKDSPGDPQQRRREMRAIRDLIAAGRLDEVPDQLRAMKRLWPGVGGLLTRRDAEAALWEMGLGAAK